MKNSVYKQVIVVKKFFEEEYHYYYFERLYKASKCLLYVRSMVIIGRGC